MGALLAVGLLASLLAVVAPPSAASTPARVPTPDLSWVPGDGSVMLSWAHPVPDRQLEASILFKQEGAGSWASAVTGLDLPADGSVTSYTIAALDNGTTYEVRLFLYDRPAVELQDSQSAALLVIPGAPLAPVVSAEPLNLEVDLDVTWAEPGNNDEAITGYQVRFKRSDAAPWPRGTGTCALLRQTCVRAGAASLNDGVIFPQGHARRAWIGGLDAGVQYDVQVRAMNSRGAGPWSATATGTPTGSPAQPVDPDDTTVSFGSATYSGTEGDTITIELGLSAAHPQPVRFHVRPDYFDSVADFYTDYSLGDCPQLDPNDPEITDEERAEAANCDFGVGLLEVEIAAGDSSFSYDIRTEDDDEEESDENFTLNIFPLSSNLELGAVASTVITIVDNDMAAAPGVVLTLPDVVVDGVTQAADKVHTTEGSSGTYTIALSAQPESWVRIYAQSAMPCKVSIIDAGYVEFNSGNWDVPQTVYARARLDYDAAGAEIVVSHRLEAPYSPSYQTVTRDPDTDEITEITDLVSIDSVTVAAADKHPAGVMVVTGIDADDQTHADLEKKIVTDLALTTGGATDYVAYPNTEPSPIYGPDPADCHDYDTTHTITVTATSSNTDVVTVSPASVTFGPGIDYTPAAFTVTATGVGTAQITHTTTTSSDPDYAAITDHKTVDITVTAPLIGQGTPDLPQQANPPVAVQRPDTVVPGPVHEVTVAADTPDSLTVTWNPPTTGDAPTRYIVHLKARGGAKGWTKTIKARRNQITFDKLETGTTYRLFIRAQNKAGKGPRTHTRITLPNPAP